MKIIKQKVSYCSQEGIRCEFQEHDIAAENNNEYVVIEGFDGAESFLVIAKPHRSYGGHKIGEVWTHETKLPNNNSVVSVIRYKTEDDEHDFDFYEIASREFANFELTKDLWVNRNGETEPRRSEVTA